MPWTQHQQFLRRLRKSMKRAGCTPEQIEKSVKDFHKKEEGKLKPLKAVPKAARKRILELCTNFGDKCIITRVKDKVFPLLVRSFKGYKNLTENAAKMRAAKKPKLTKPHPKPEAHHAPAPVG